MPIPGPRSQSGPDPGYRNPGRPVGSGDGPQSPDRFNMWSRPGPVFWPGRTPGAMVVTLRGCQLAAGQIRRLWRQSVDYIPAQAAFSWTSNAPSPDRPDSFRGGFEITRALRYMTHSLYIGSGIDHSRFDALHTVVNKQNAYKTVTVNVGQTRSRPTVRNRITSFGSRVPTLNQSVVAAENQPVGKASQA